MAKTDPKKLAYHRLYHAKKKSDPEYLAKRAEYREKNRQTLRAYHRKRRAENIESERERDRSRRADATPEQRERRNHLERERYAAKKAELRAKSRARYAANRAEHRAKADQRKARNRPHHTQWSREYSAKRRQSDPQYRIAASLRARARAVLLGTNKSASSMELIGCSWWELRLQIEAQWLEGMTWENYSRAGWHIDHIVPLKAFDLTDPAQQRAAFHYTNLQPLWAVDNLRKGAKC